MTMMEDVQTYDLTGRSVEDLANNSDSESRKRRFDSANDTEGHTNNKKMNTDTFMVKMLVPSMFAGAVIGKKGSNITAVQEETGVRVKLSPSGELFPMTSERILVMNGPVENCAVALRKILGYMAENDRDRVEGEEKLVTIRLVIPSPAAGLLIGKGGSHIRGLSEASGATIHISDKRESPPGVDERLVSVRGQPESAQNAMGMILRKMAEDPDSCVYTNKTTFYGRRMNYGRRGDVNRAGPYGDSYGDSGLGGGYRNSAPAAYPMAHMEGPDTTVTIQVADAFVGAVLGKGGRTIHDIQESSGVRVSISKRGEFVEGTSNRTVTIQGPSQCTQRAQFLITKKIQEAMAMSGM